MLVVERWHQDLDQRCRKDDYVADRKVRENATPESITSRVCRATIWSMVWRLKWGTDLNAARRRCIFGAAASGFAMAAVLVEVKSLRRNSSVRSVECAGDSDCRVGDGFTGPQIYDYAQNVIIAW